MFEQREGTDGAAPPSNRRASLRRPVLALASALHCREGQAWSLIVAALVASVLAATGLPPVLSHRPAAAALPQAPAGTSGRTGPPAGPVPTMPTGPAETPVPLPGGAGLPLPPPFASGGGGQGATSLVPLGTTGPAPAPAPVLSGTPTVVRGREGTALSAAVPVDGRVALISDPSSSQFTATVAWGDGSAPAEGKVTPTSPGAFEVTAAHTYDEDGTYRIDVTVTDGAGNVLVVTSQADVADPADALDQALDRASDAG